MATVNVTNIASSTPDREVEDFFAFCGKIAKVTFETDGDKKSAAVTFEQETAAKTALMLSKTRLGPNEIYVSGDVDGDGADEAAAAAPVSDSANDEKSGAEGPAGGADVLTQEEKPRSRIFAEVLAHGYVVGDAALQKAIDLDHKHGVMQRFMNTLTRIDHRYHAVDKARAADENYHISRRATSLLTGVGSYFERASTSSSPCRRIVDFYTVRSKQVQDIHAEARRLADLKKEQHGGSAYKASGLERVFGKEKPAAEGSAAPAAGKDAPVPAAASSTST